jgi:hypothetical protein
MIIHLQFGFSQFISFREEDLWNFSQSEHIIGPGSHVEYPTVTKNSNFLENLPGNIPAKFGSNWPSGFGVEAWNVKGLQTTDDGRQVMAIVHLDLWSRWTNYHYSQTISFVTNYPLWIILIDNDYRFIYRIFTYGYPLFFPTWGLYQRLTTGLLLT